MTLQQPQTHPKNVRGMTEVRRKSRHLWVLLREDGRGVGAQLPD